MSPVGWSWWPQQSQIQQCQNLQPWENLLWETGAVGEPSADGPSVVDEISGSAQCQRVRKTEKEMSWELPQHPGETEMPAALMENLPCSKGVTCAFQVTSTWMSYSSPCQEGLQSPGQWLEGRQGSGTSLRCLPYSTFALSPLCSSSTARMRSRSLMSCTPQ